MERAGEKLKRVRERLQLTYREVSRASKEIAQRRGSDEFLIALSRLADIENKGTVPSIFRLYSLCAIYRLNLDEVLRWYGVPKDQLCAEGLQITLKETHAVQFLPVENHATVTIPVELDEENDFRRTTFLTKFVRRMGKLPFDFLGSLDGRQYRYGFIGLDDWFMYPILQPGSLLTIDDNRRKIAPEGWTSEFDRPIYFLEHRDGYACGWCSITDDYLLVQPHPASLQKPQLFKYPDAVDIVGQVVGVAMLLDSKKRRSVRPEAVPVMSPDL